VEVVLAVGAGGPEMELCQQNGHHSKVEWIDNKFYLQIPSLSSKIVNYQPKKKSNLIIG
jgi:hypothetical protein